ncbi:hypothetical protein PVAND_017160 [Polypedilum vanderplanki]|uniref:Uncharacterized protein n=1 Tax=Polypedilum vanderplanki TaxID=319348 RepID=A0A9J6BHI3_POLVA|nr:hypothetical protein PVAND_017160 [Polypedilum vanderplanki]
MRTFIIFSFVILAFVVASINAGGSSQSSEISSPPSSSISYTKPYKYDYEGNKKRTKKPKKGGKTTKKSKSCNSRIQINIYKMKIFINFSFIILAFIVANIDAGGSSISSEISPPSSSVSHKKPFEDNQMKPRNFDEKEFGPLKRGRAHHQRFENLVSD